MIVEIVWQNVSTHLLASFSTAIIKILLAVKLTIIYWPSVINARLVVYETPHR